MRSLFLLPLCICGACSFLEGKLPTEKPALYDMEEPLALHQEPDDEEQREALPAGGFTGVYVADARQSLEEMESEPEGVLVQRVVENSPGDAAGLVEGDILLEVGGKELSWASEWRDAELNAEPGTELTVVYDRAGAEREAKLTVVRRVHPAERAAVERFREEDRVGIVVRTATEVEARAAGLGPGGGAVVVGLARSSPWRSAGLRFGNLIVAVNGEPVAHPGVVLKAIRDAEENGAVKVAYLDDGARREIEAPVTRRATETTKVSIPLLYYYEKDRSTKRMSIFFWIYQHKRTPAAWETKIFWIFKFRGGDADRLEEVKQEAADRKVAEQETAEEEAAERQEVERK